MKRAPYEYYAKYLLTRFNVDATKHKLESSGFGTQDREFLRVLRRKVFVGKPSPCVTGSQAHEAWLRKHRVYQLSAGKQDALSALEVLQTPRLRSALEIMLTGGVSTEESSERLFMLSGTECPKSVVELYQHYFWNVNLLAGRDDWREFLTHTEKYTAPSGEVGYRLADRYPQGRLLLTVYESDPEVALWRIGVKTDIDDAVILSTVVNDTFMRWQELRHETSSPITTVKMERVGNLLIKAIQEKREAGAQMATINHLQHQLALKVRSYTREDGRLLLSDDRDSTEILEPTAQNAKVLTLPVGRNA